MNRLSLFAGLLTGSLLLLPPAPADTFTYIFHGKVVMEDGTAPPKSVGIERVCSDINGTAPGPFTNKQGEYTWRMDLNAEVTRACVIQAVMPGYSSSQVDINFDTQTANVSTVNLKDIMLTSKVQDPKIIVISNEGVPNKSLKAWKEAMQDLEKNDYPSAATKIQESIEASPKFPRGPYTLGLVYANQQKFDQARESFQKAIEVDPKYLPAQVMMARMCIRSGDWQCAAKVSGDVMKLDAKKMFLSEMLMHQAVAKLATKDISGAEATIQESLDHDPAHKNARAEYVLGRILEAKGDANGAKQHMNQYLQLAPTTPDADQIRARIQIIGTPLAASGQQPALEIQ